MLRELADLEFEYVELSHGIRLSLVPGILKALEEGWIKISSVHNFCPLPPGVMGAAPNLYEPSAPGKRERALWLNHTLRTLDFANRVGADLMVIHSGSVRFLLGDPEGAFENFRQSSPNAEVEAWESARNKQLSKIRGKQKRFRKLLEESYQVLIPHAKERGVRLGIENREGLTELPLDYEMRGLLENLGEPETVGYWHDAGHAQMKEMMGFISHEQMLMENANRQFGFHLHDVSAEERDHQPPGTGVIDWDMLSLYIEPHHIVVLELSPRLRSKQVVESKAFVAEKLSGRVN